ncbi:hypothetical protein BC936DRAFT_144755 [Jimgerdemannia flammicorona]|uniref:Putative ER transporter 6TM N-terminal domain-containing protein n=1 Tax=Jimgerdemannia flammicorona TaxID=994334 RepID=A0A433DBS4_9FUNG|nr:hypothetical protein BC936DRAFT_144755 [Jimgerdemannia flammicorona]
MSEEAGHGDADNAGASEPARWSFQDELNKGTHRPGKLCFRPNLYYGSYHATPHSTPLPSPGPSTPTHTVGKGWLDHVTQQAARSSTLPGSPLAHHAKALEDHFDMEENREGFFDMTVFETPGGNDKTNNLPHHVTFSDEPRTSTSPTLNEDVQIAIDEGIPPWEPSPSPPQSPSSSPSPTRRILQFAPILRQILDYFKPTLHPRVQHRIHKAVFATLIASLFTLIPPVQQWVGPYAAMSAVSLVYNHPARTVGAQVEAAFVGLFGILVGMTISLAGVGASVAYNAKYLQYGDHAGRVILVVFLLTGSFFVTYVWAKYPRFNLSGIMATFIMVFSLTTNVDNTTFSGKYVFDVVCPLSIGNIVALFINILIWRESASQGLGRAVDESLSEIRNLLNLTTSAFLLDPDRLDLPNSVVEEASSNMRKAMAKVLIADREARYEISYGYVRPSDFKDITKTIGRLAQHLSSLALSLRNEKFLLEARHGSVQMSKGYLELLTKLQDAGIEDHSTCTTCLKHHVSRPEGAWPRPLSRTHSELHLHTHKEDSESECDGDSPADHDKLGRPLSRSLFDLNQDTVTSIGSLAEHPSRPKMSPRRSDLSLDSPRRRPLPRKEIAFGDKRLLVKYLQGVKDPLAELTISCENTLDAMRLELAKELDIGVSHISLNENDAEASKSNPASRGKQWLRLLSLMTRKVPPVGEAAPAPAPDHSAQITAAIESFDSHEKQHLESMQYNATFRYFDLGHREELFLVFNFMFSLREVARELRNLADGVMTLKTAEPGCGGKRRKRIYLPRIDVSEWLRSSNHFMEKDRGGNLPAIFDQDDDEDDEILPSDSTTLGVSEQDGVESDNYEARPASSLEFLRVRRCLWYYTHGIGSYETKFAVKMALAITVISSLAFFDTTMEQFNEVRWQWASMSVFLVMNPAVGGTIWEGFLRVGGTVFGGLAGMATCAIIGPKSYVLTCLEVVMGKWGCCLVVECVA